MGLLSHDNKPHNIHKRDHINCIFHILVQTSVKKRISWRQKANESERSRMLTYVMLHKYSTLAAELSTSYFVFLHKYQVGPVGYDHITNLPLSLSYDCFHAVWRDCDCAVGTPFGEVGTPIRHPLLDIHIIALSHTDYLLNLLTK